MLSATLPAPSSPVSFREARYADKWIASECVVIRSQSAKTDGESGYFDACRVQTPLERSPWRFRNCRNYELPS